MVVYIDNNGLEFKQLFQHYPALKPLYTDFEINYNAQPFADFVANNLWVSFVFVVAYVAFCYFGTKLMKDRLAFDLKWPLVAWNLLLSVFSFCGAVRLIPHLLHSLFNNGLRHTVCHNAENAHGMGAAGLWTVLFIASKVPELFDTTFIVMRKRPLLFLHWYHHVTVLLYCWHSYATRNSAGIWFICMNYLVHCVMYFYYFLSALGYRPVWAPVVTVMQISQMFVGVAMCVLVYRYSKDGGSCAVSHANYIAGLLMYFSYFVLFVQYAVKRFCKRGPKLAAGKKSN